jgi:TRAP-type C4-dicarboxylate transport system permease small subunit
MADPTRLRTTFDALDRATITIAAVALVSMAVVQGWQVFARYVLNDSPSWTEPLALLFMSTTMMFGAATGVRAGRHFGFYILVETSKPRVRTLLLTFARLVALALGLMLAIWSGQMAAESWDYSIAGAPLPHGVIYMPMCLGGALIALFSLEHLVGGREASSGSPEGEVR